MSLRHAFRNSLRPGYASVIARKLTRRVSPREHTRSEAIAWARPRAIPPGRWCEAVDAELWAEASAFGERLASRAETVAAETGYAVAGGARAELLYFLTRLTQPDTIVETGVAYGFSSYAFLEAIRVNGRGSLYSSDFPYFREHDPERRVGVLVPDELRSGWTLLLAGDERNLPVIVQQAGTIDLLHYDSDKSYAGRRRAMQLLTPHLAPDAVVVMDDIQDNLFFHDLVANDGDESVVLGHTTAFVGALGVPTRSELGV